MPTEETTREPFHYLNRLREFLADNEEDYPLAPWLATLEEDDLVFLTDAIDEYQRVSGNIDQSLFTDALALVVQIIAIEKQAPSFSCSVEQLDQYMFTLGVCGAFELMRRAGLVRILSPMLLTSDHTPTIELIEIP